MGRTKAIQRRLVIASAAVALVLALALSGVALGAARSSVQIKAPKHVKAGHGVKLVFSGFAARPSDVLAVLLDTRRCARTGTAEGKRSGVTENDFTLKPGKRFRDTLSILSSSRGTHWVCAYVQVRRTLRTTARASAHYRTT